MFGFGDAQDNYNQLNSGNHEAKFSHELLAGGASFMAFKAFEDHQRKEGKTVNHAFAKELLAGFVGGEVDKLIETKGADFIDREEAKRQAKKNAEEMYDSHYGNQDQYDPNQAAPGHIEDSFGKY
ncbi:Putative CipC protein [[Torrubiella] hemipterigena]|uniref:Putative CipC protein n=1 Tax=[Torrubiella] hemipterigena TaxID=1531966 RepID=A0A0A1T405_9HYPO|nr:Putative CipC protein [[Torrubiella] hemipterigena]